MFAGNHSGAILEEVSGWREATKGTKVKRKDTRHHLSLKDFHQIRGFASYFSLPRRRSFILHFVIWGRKKRRQHIQGGRKSLPLEVRLCEGERLGCGGQGRIEGGYIEGDIKRVQRVRHCGRVKSQDMNEGCKEEYI